MAVKVVDISRETSPTVYGPAMLRANRTMIHSSGGMDSRGWLQGDSLKAGEPVSTHDLIGKDGTCYVIVKNTMVAWHAGVSLWPVMGRLVHGLNEDTIGIEIENSHTPGDLITMEQHAAAALRHRYHSMMRGYALDACVGHYEVAQPIGRRSDPLNFVWGWFWFYVYNPSSAQNKLGGL